MSVFFLNAVAGANAPFYRMSGHVFAEFGVTAPAQGKGHGNA
jgi:hypothetical protein